MEIAKAVNPLGMDALKGMFIHFNSTISLLTSCKEGHFCKHLKKCPHSRRQMPRPSWQTLSPNEKLFATG